MPRQKVRYYANEIWLFEDLLSRYVRFHEGEDMRALCGKCWGLGMYGEIRPVRDKGYITSTCRKENKRGWYSPSQEILEKVIYPAYLLYKADTGALGHDKFDLNYTMYIQEAIRQLDLTIGANVIVIKSNRTGTIAEIQKSVNGRNIYVVDYGTGYSDGYFGNELYLVK